MSEPKRSNRGIGSVHQQLRNRLAAFPAPLLTALAVFAALAVIPRAGLAQEADASSPALQLFEAFYAEIVGAAEDSRLPAEAASKAKDVRFDLERDLIRADAEIEILKLEVARFTGERQAEALDGLLHTVAKRERRIYDQIQRLEELAGMPVCLSEERSGEKEAQKKRRFNLTWEPEEFVDDVPP